MMRKVNLSTSAVMQMMLALHLKVRLDLHACLPRLVRGLN